MSEVVAVAKTENGKLATVTTMTESTTDRA